MSNLFDPAPFDNNLPEGEARRDRALNVLRVRRADLIKACSAAALQVVLETGEVCADDVRAMVPIPPGLSPKLVGAVFRDLADEGILRRLGYKKSQRPKAHARPISQWALTDRAAASALLAKLSK